MSELVGHMSWRESSSQQELNESTLRSNGTSFTATWEHWMCLLLYQVSSGITMKRGGRIPPWKEILFSYESQYRIKPTTSGSTFYVYIPWIHVGMVDEWKNEIDPWQVNLSVSRSTKIVKWYSVVSSSTCSPSSFYYVYVDNESKVLLLSTSSPCITCSVIVILV